MASYSVIYCTYDIITILHIARTHHTQSYPEFYHHCCRPEWGPLQYVLSYTVVLLVLSYYSIPARRTRHATTVEDTNTPSHSKQSSCIYRESELPRDVCENCLQAFLRRYKYIYYSEASNAMCWNCARELRIAFLRSEHVSNTKTYAWAFLIGVSILQPDAGTRGWPLTFGCISYRAKRSVTTFLGDSIKFKPSCILLLLMSYDTNC